MVWEIFVLEFIIAIVKVKGQTHSIHYALNMVKAVELYKVSQIALSLSLSAVTLTACGSDLLMAQSGRTAQTQAASQLASPLQDKPRPTFHLDEQLLSNYQTRKSQLADLIQVCKAQKYSLGPKGDTKQPFVSRKVEPARLQTLSLSEVAKEIKRNEALPEDFGGLRILFVVDYYKNDPADMFVEEKGYLYSSTPLRQDLLENGSLDQFSGQLLFEKYKSQEAWRYKQIEPNWYLYYRQYFYPFMG